MMLAALVYSTRSRKNRKDPQLAGRVHAVLPAGSTKHATSTVADMRDALQSCAQRGVNTLFLLGGDGTHRVALEAAIEAYGEERLPRIRFLRGGTMNTVAQSLGIPRRSPEALARSVIDGTLRTVQRPLLRVRSDAATHYGFLFGTGVMHHFLEHYERNADPTALDGARTLVAALAECTNLAPKSVLARDRLSIQIDGAPASLHHALTVGAATVDQVGLGFRPFHGAQDSVDAFRTMVLDGAAWRLPLALPGVRMGRPFPRALALEATCTTLRISAADGADVQYMIDGDLFPSTKAIQVSLGPTLQLLV